MFRKTLLVVAVAHLCSAQQLADEATRKSVIATFVGTSMPVITANSTALKEIIVNETNKLCQQDDYKTRCCKDIKYETLGSGDIIVPGTNLTAEDYIRFLSVAGDSSANTTSSVKVTLAIVVPQEADENDLCLIETPSRRKRSTAEDFLSRRKRHSGTTPAPTAAPNYVYLDPDLAKLLLNSNSFRAAVNSQLGLISASVVKSDEKNCTAEDDIQPWVIALITIASFLLLLLLAATVMMCHNGSKNNPYSKELMGSVVRVSPTDAEAGTSYGTYNRVITPKLAFT
ncbi:Hypp5134 [Branchiostoma lanceolatum]|uniref:Hypp5134 protein n=1 Tax=Branchiostoma lanceolatum TaxID=7740 RepID=A0A8K0F364_BRALA|nr:Hypp5134 [Branchiostoma lanceolatum]